LTVLAYNVVKESSNFPEIVERAIAYNNQSSLYKNFLSRFNDVEVYREECWSKINHVVITAALQGFSCVNGVRRSSEQNMKLRAFAKGTIVYHLISNLAWVIILGRLLALPNLVQVR